MRHSKLLAAVPLLLSLLSSPSASQELDGDLRLMLSEAYRLMEHVESRWPGWDGAPEAVLLVHGEHEYLVGHPAPSEDFRAMPDTKVAGRSVLTRPRVSPPGLLATYPAVGGIPTIVVGTPEATGLNPTRWILTLVHEHFHQMQMSDPGYYPGVGALDLSGGDDSGMWMLNYPFPYDDARVAPAVEALGRLAAEWAVESVSAPGPTPERLATYLRTRDTLAEVTDARDLRYLAFQLWQEGTARFAELDAARAAAETFRVSDRFAALPGFIGLEEAADELWQGIVDGVGHDLSTRGRVYFYALGALEAFLLDATRPDWRDRYMQEPFDTGAYWRDAGGA